VLDEKELQKVSAVFSALGSPVRLKIVELVRETEKPLHIKAVAQVLKKDYATVYRHVKVMEKCGLVGVHEVGRSRVIYLKNPDLIADCVQLVKKLL
jgi:DNA-binding transcriptional ArsR family regulator